MVTDITYTNHLGASLTFGGDDETLNYLAHQLRDYAWTRKELGGRTVGYKREPRDMSFPVGIAAKTGESGLALRDMVFALAEADTAAGINGRLEICGYWMECCITGCRPTNYWMDDRYAELSLTVHADDPVWTRDHLYHFDPTSEWQEGEYLDFPFDFDFDFAPPAPLRTIACEAPSACPILWRVFGPAQNPRISIDGNIYGVDIDIAPGCRLEVESREGHKAVRLVDAAGATKDVFNERLRGAAGSGSYIFEPIRPGSSVVGWDNSFGFDLVVYNQVSAPPWSSPTIRGTTWM